MSTKHTPEPWKVVSSINCDGYAIDHQDMRKPYVTDYIDEADAKRIVECVNAMAGIENPVEFMEVVKKLELDAYHKMKAERDDLRKSIAEIAVVLTFQDNHKLAQKVRELLIDYAPKISNQ